MNIKIILTAVLIVLAGSFFVFKNNNGGAVMAEVKRKKVLTAYFSRTGVKSGFAIYGHTAQNNRQEADKKVSEWLKFLGY